MIAMLTENGTTRINVEGTAPEICADAALCALNAVRMYAEYTSCTYNNKSAAALSLMQTVLCQFAKENDEILGGDTE